MAQDNGQDFAAGPAVTLITADVADDAASPWTPSVDFGAPTPRGFGYGCVLTCGAGATGPVVLEVAWSQDDIDFSDENNAEPVAIITAKASDDAKKSGDHPIRAQYAKFRLNNQSGGLVDGTGSNTALDLWDIFGDTA